MREGVKALVLMNGGGSVALLAFLQAVWDKAPALIGYSLAGLACLVVGVALAGLVQFFRVHTSNATQRMFYMASQVSQPKPSFVPSAEEYGDTNAAIERYQRLYFVCAYASLILFVVGVGIILFGAAVEPRIGMSVPPF